MMRFLTGLVDPLIVAMAALAAVGYFYRRLLRSGALTNNVFLVRRARQCYNFLAALAFGALLVFPGDLHGAVPTTFLCIAVAGFFVLSQNPDIVTPSEEIMRREREKDAEEKADAAKKAAKHAAKKAEDLEFFKATR